MLETKEQKQVFVGAVVMIILLVAISFWHRPDLTIKDQAKTAKPSQDYLSSQAYLDYLKTVKVDKQASQELFQTLLTQDDIKNQVVDALQSNQTITQPQVDDKKLKIVANGSDKVNQYLSDSVSEAYSFNNNTLSLSQDLFNGDAQTVGQIDSRLQTLIARLYALPVPESATALHKSLITAYLAYQDLLSAAKNYNVTDYAQNDALWPAVYKNYAIANTAANNYSQQLTQLAAKYQISQITVTDYYANAHSQKKFALVPQAQAFLGVSYSFTMGDVPRIVMDSVKEALRSAYLQFMGSMLNKLLTKIEQNYVVSNFLYYTDALIDGQYSDDYLNKYVNDQLDRQIIKKLIPQFNCGKQDANLKAVFEAKATDYLGFDPKTVSLSDSDYYTKMARVGNFLSSAQGWQEYYQDMAAQTQSAAEKAANAELTSSGLKTPRNTSVGGISNSINSIISAERAGFASVLELGINNAESLISATVAQLTETLMNQFVFQGVTTNNNGSIAVLKEQATCVSSAVLTPIVAMPTTQYQNASSTVSTTQAATAYTCSGVSTLSSDCTTAVENELKICAGTGQHTGTQTCGSLKSSAYTQALLAQCGKGTAISSECLALQSNLSKIP